MSETVTLVLVCLGAILGMAARALFSALFVDAVKAAFTDRMRAMVRRAAAKLPGETAADLEDEWLEELDAFKDRPLRAFRFARGVGSAAEEIAAAARPPHRASEDAGARGSGRSSARARLRSYRRLALVGSGAAVLAVPQVMGGPAVPALLMVFALAYVTRLVLHFSLGYWSPATPAGRRLSVVTALEAVVAVLWVACAIGALLWPDPVFLGLVSITLLGAVPALALVTARLAQQRALPGAAELMVYRVRRMLARRDQTGPRYRM
ncbi:MAG: hypothetical protein M3340_14695 [Actinomycetota bacterium]|nr:hypothetical protein [Actinomycetota bacterium]